MCPIVHRSECHNACSRQPHPVATVRTSSLCLYVMKETDRDRFEAVVDTLHAAFKTFERIDFPPAAAGMLTLAWKDRDFSAPCHPHQLSEELFVFSGW